MRILHLSVLGEPSLTDCDGRVLARPGAKALGLLACLASAPDLCVSRATLAELIWSDAVTTSAARHALRQCLVRLRRQLGDFADVLVADDRTVWLNPDLVVVDLAKAQQAIQSDAPDLIVALSGAIRGRFCAGLDCCHSDFDNWLRVRQRECDHLCANLHRKAAEILARRGKGEAAIAAARRWIESEPFQDDAHAALITLCCALGHRQAAAEAHRVCHRLFHEELGISPAPEVDRALATPIPMRRIAFPAALPQHNPVSPPRRRMAGAFFVGLSAAVILIQMSKTEHRASELASPARDISLWVSAASAASPVEASGNGLHLSYRVVADKGKDDGDNTDYAMLYPAGC